MKSAILSFAPKPAVLFGFTSDGEDMSQAIQGYVSCICKENSGDKA